MVAVNDMETIKPNNKQLGYYRQKEGLLL